MKLHANARLSVKGRELLVDRVEDAGWSVMQAAEAAGISERSAHKWLGRYRAEGTFGLLDRSSAPLRVANRTDERRVEAIAALRRSREQRIKEHLAILSLPEDLQERVAAGEIPLLAVRAMVGLCQIHEDLARAAVIAATPGNYEEPYSWSEIAESPLAIAVNCCEQLPPGVFPTRTSHTLEVFTLGEKARKDLADYQQIAGRPLQEIHFTAEEVEQARALGAVHDAGWLQVIADEDVADRLAEDHIHRTLKRAAGPPP